MVHPKSISRSCQRWEPARARWLDCGSVKMLGLIYRGIREGLITLVLSRSGDDGVGKRIDSQKNSQWKGERKRKKKKRQERRRHWWPRRDSSPRRKLVVANGKSALWLLGVIYGLQCPCIACQLLHWTLAVVVFLFLNRGSLCSHRIILG